MVWQQTLRVQARLAAIANDDWENLFVVEPRYRLEYINRINKILGVACPGTKLSLKSRVRWGRSSKRPQTSRVSESNPSRMLRNNIAGMSVRQNLYLTNKTQRRRAIMRCKKGRYLEIHNQNTKNSKRNHRNRTDISPVGPYKR
jgi:hypothetical protein